MTTALHPSDVVTRSRTAPRDPGAGLRRTGIDVVGDAVWGTHFCQFYATREDLCDVLVPYFKAGLEAGEHCMWITSPPLGAEEAWAALAGAMPDLEEYRRRGRIEILSHTEWYLRDGVFDQERVLQGWVTRLEDALARGCAGLRLSGNTFWLERRDWRSFAEYEAAIDSVLGRYRMLALCTYSTERCGALEIADVIRNHEFALIKRDGRWEMIESHDRRRMQDALTAERERLAVTLQSIGDAVIGTDTRGCVTTLNPVAEELTGWRLAEAAGRPIADVFRVVREETGEAIEAPVAEVLSSGGTTALATHTVLVARDGRRFPIQDSAAPIRGRRGELLGAVLVFRDATAERDSERQRDRTIEFLRLVHETRGLGELTRAATRYLRTCAGCEVEIRLGAGVAAGAAGDGSAAAFPLQSGATGVGVLRLAAAPGERIAPPALELCERLAGYLGGALAAAQAQEALRDSEARYRTLFEEGRRGEARIQRQNAVLSGIARISREALTCQSEEDLGRACVVVAEEVTQSCFAFLGEVDRGGRLHDLAVAVAGGAATGEGGEAPGLAAEGLYAPLLRERRGFFTNDPGSHPDHAGTPAGHPALRSFLGVPLLHAGEPMGVLALANRPTGYGPDQLEAAEALAAVIVQALLRRRAEEEVRRANAQLRDVDRRKNEFLATLSHELRNPLAPIRNSVFVLEHAGADAEQARRAQAVIRRQVGHLTRLVDDLLDVTRIARGKIELRRERLDLGALLVRAAEDHGALLRDRGLELGLEVPPEPVFTDGDPTRLTQVIGNLLLNAAKFTPGGGQVTLALRTDGDAAELRVRDNGAGIEPGLLARVFEPFVQAERTVTSTGGGLGLGLALVKGIAELHGGSARAESAGAGRGAELIVRLPLVAAAAAIPPAPEVARPQATRHVLVVDDNVDAAESLGQLAELFGHTAEVAHDGPTALARARARRPDVIFCDIGLPGMSGYEVVRAVRADEALRGVRVFAVSGYAQPQDRQRSADAGFDGHVAKPSDPEEILRILS